MSDSTLLRKRAKPRQSTGAVNRRHEKGAADERKYHNAGGSYYSGTMRTMALLLAGLFLAQQLLLHLASFRDGGIDVMKLEPIEMLSTVPLGFTLDLPRDQGPLELYLDSQLISSVADPAPTKDGPGSFNFGTCDIADHGENVLSHAFSLGRGELGNLKSVLLRPGDHVVEIQRRNGTRLLPYAQMEVKVHAPPELILTSSGDQHSPYVDAYELALREIGSNVACNHFVAGTGWSQLWTRDTSFAAELGAALIHPNVVKRSLMASVEVWRGGKEVWLQDKCGHFGGWPNLSDAIVGVRGAWSLYLVTGDKEFLSWAYDVTKNSLRRAEEEVLDISTGLFLGCSSFLESNSGYPEKYMNDGELVGRTKALSTNMLYYAGYNLASKMGKELGEADPLIHDLERKANLLKATIQKRLWSPSKSNYAYFEDEFGKLVDTTEGLGTSLALLDFNDDEKNSMMLKSTHTTEYGITCLWPQFKYSPGFFEWRIARHYHNGRIWPFVQGYWAMAAAQHRQPDLLSKELRGLMLLSQKGNTFAEFYELNATFPEERRSQLWSATGYLSMFYHGVFGIRLELDGIRFAPMKPADLFKTEIHLNNIRYRGMTLNIHLHGDGTEIDTFELNHKKQSNAFINSDATGVFDVDIRLKQ